MSTKIREYIDEVASCDYPASESPGWLWAPGWHDKRSFKGKCLSKADTFEFLGGYPEEDRRAIAAGTVQHGWVLTVVGATEGCGWDETMWFETTEPVVVDGMWDGAIHYDDEGEEHPCEVVDGPTKATWLRPKT